MRQPDCGLPAQPARLDHPRRPGRGRIHPEHQQRGAARDAGTAFATGKFNRVPIIDGTNRDEWRLFVALSELAGNPVTASNYQSMISSTLGVPAAAAAVIAAKYPLSAFPSPSVALGAVGTDAIFGCPALTIDQSVSKFVPTFAYEFNDENAPELFLPPVSFPYGAAHASEIQYLIGLPAAAFPQALSVQQQSLATIMKTEWTSFAKIGLPFSLGSHRGEGPGGQGALPGRLSRLRRADRGPRRQGRRVPVLQALPSRRDRANPDPRVGARRDAHLASAVRESAVVDGLVSHSRPPARWRGAETPAGRRLAGAVDGHRPVRHLGGGAIRRLP